MSNCPSLYGRTSLPADYGEGKLWTGIFAAACSFFCVVGIFLDIVRSVRCKKPWISCEWFTLNAITIALLGFSTSITSEIIEPMPGLLEQFAKVSGILLICVCMNHVMPSLSLMEGEALLQNMLALFVVIITTFYYLRSQIHTKLILDFARGITYFSAVMNIIFVILVSHCLSVPTTKKFVESRYEFRHKNLMTEVDNETPSMRSPKLKLYIQKYWLMTLTSSPDYILRASGIAQVVALLCITVISSFITFFVTNANDVLSMLSAEYQGCLVVSHYGGSISAVLVVHVMAILLGLAESFLRLWTWKPGNGFGSCTALIDVENNKLQKLEEWRKHPLPIDNKILGRVVFRARNVLVQFVVKPLQYTIIIICKLFLCLNIIVDNIILCPCLLLSYLYSSCCSVANTQEGDQTDTLGDYVLILDGVEDTRGLIAKKWKEHPEKWIRSGQGNPPANLQNLLDEAWRSQTQSRTTRLGGRMGQYLVRIFEDIDIIPSDGQIPVLRDCRSLHVITIACIINAGFPTDEHMGLLKALNFGVTEGFRYAKFIDKNVSRALKETRHAAKMVWESLTYGRKWVDIPMNSFRRFDTFAERIEEFKRMCDKVIIKHSGRENGDEWPVDLIAAKSAYYIMDAMSTFADENGNRPIISFEEWRVALGHVLSEFLTKLPLAIFRECSRGSYGSRESHVRKAALVLGETEAIRNLLTDPPHVHRRSGSSVAGRQTTGTLESTAVQSGSAETTGEASGACIVPMPTTSSVMVCYRSRSL